MKELRNGGGFAAAGIADEQGVLAVQHDPLHFPFGDVVVHGHRAIGGEHVQSIPLIERVADRLGHRVLGQEPILPVQQAIAQPAQDLL